MIIYYVYWQYASLYVCVYVYVYGGLEEGRDGDV